MSKAANIGRKGAIRQKALKGVDLANMERHGKREDESGKRRRVREEAPLVYGSLEVRELRAAHLDGVQRSRGAKTECLHALVQYPTKLIDGADKEKQQWMLDHAVRFMDNFHGGDAVFAARLDRDEKGQHSVDVFAMPRYEHHYKDGRKVMKASVSKFSKEQARARYTQPNKKTGKQVPRDDRRAQGSALQDAWYEYMRDEMGLAVEAPDRKKATTADRVEPEVYGLKADERRFKARQIEFRKRALAIKKDLQAENKALKDEKKTFDDEKRSAATALAAARRVAVEKGDGVRADALREQQQALTRPRRGRER